MDPSPQFPTGNDRLSVARGLILMGSLNLDPSICCKKKNKATKSVCQLYRMGVLEWVITERENRARTVNRGFWSQRPGVRWPHVWWWRHDRYLWRSAVTGYDNDGNAPRDHCNVKVRFRLSYSSLGQKVQTYICDPLQVSVAFLRSYMHLQRHWQKQTFLYRKVLLKR